MRKHKVGDPGGRIVEAVVKAITESTDGVRLQVSFGMRRREFMNRRSSHQMLKACLALKYEWPK
jgi:hypothetical protein